MLGKQCPVYIIKTCVDARLECDGMGVLKYKCPPTIADYEEFEMLDPKKSKEGKLSVCSPAYHPEFHYPLFDVAEMSVEKGYKPLNWLDADTRVTASYLIAAAQRHLDKIKMGVDINTEERALNGEATKFTPYHAAQVAYNMLMYCMLHQKGTLKDDRLFKDGERK